MLTRIRRRSSLTDNEGYPEFCELAASDDRLFATFKSQPTYTAVLEHVPCDAGEQLLRIALDRSPEFRELLDRFRTNDTVGSPNLCDYGEYGKFSATTLRYVKTLSDLDVLFGQIDGMRIVEIGGGYGGQCLIASQIAQWASYTLIDLKPCLALAERYLRTHKVPAVHFVPPGQVDALGPFDLLISNYAFSELTRRFQRRYVNAVVRTSGRGYVTCNWTTPKGFRSYSSTELLRLMPHSRLAPEEPLQAAGDVVWIWGTG